MMDSMETSAAKQQIFPDSTTTLLSGKQDIVPAGSGLQVAADTGDMDPSFTDLLLSGDNFFLNGSTESYLMDTKQGSSPHVLDLTTSTHLLSSSNNPILLSGPIPNEDSNIVTSTSQDDGHLRKSNVIILPQPPTSLLATPSLVEGDNNIYTLTLTDGSVVQLRVQSEVNQQQVQQPIMQFPKQETDDLTTLESCCWLQTESSGARCVHCEMCSVRQTNLSPPSSVGEEVTLPFSNASTPPSSPEDLTITALGSTAAEFLRDSLSPVSPRDVMPMYSYPKSRTSTPIPAPMAFRSSSFCSEDSQSQCNDGSSAASTYDDDDLTANDLSALFATMDNVTIESLKARLCAGQPEGPTFDLGALLVAAKIDLTVNEIVSPPLNTVKKIMEQNKLSDWQVALCLKIRRRKKNTAAVRSSRRKRNQYVVDLRHHVEDLRKRRQDLQVEYSLLEQLTSLWERLCKEVEDEIQEGVKQQLGFQTISSAATSPQLSPMPRVESGKEEKKPSLIILPPVDKISHQNIRGKRKLDAKPIKTHLAKRRQTGDNMCPLMVSFKPISDQPRLTSPGLLLEDEVVPQASSPQSEPAAAPTPVLKVIPLRERIRLKSFAI